MGREIRRVPPNWNHPCSQHAGPHPMYDKTFQQETAEWQEEKRKWDAGERPSYFDPAEYPTITFEKWHGPAPHDPDRYRPWKDEEATWFQVWETVSEGTPVTPPFATLDELAQYLADNGDFGDQYLAKEERGGYRIRDATGWGKERADAFVRSGWSPTLACINGQWLESKDMSIAMELKGG